MKAIWHYVYKISWPDGHFYFGVRSCKCLPWSDKYDGSPYTHKANWARPHSKQIVAIFATREEANECEYALIKATWKHELSYNENCGGKHFICTGHTKATKAKFRQRRMSNEAKAKISIKSKGHKQTLLYHSEATKLKISNMQINKRRRDSPKAFKLINAEGQILSFDAKDTLAEFCRKHGLLKANICMLLKGYKARNTHKGWRLYNG